MAATSSRCANGTTGAGDARIRAPLLPDLLQRHHRQRDGDQTAIRPAEADQQAEHRCRHPTLPMKVIKGADRSQQEQPFRIRRVEERRKWIGGQQQRRGTGRTVAHQQACQTRQIHQRQKERRERDEDAGPQRPHHTPLPRQARFTRSDQFADRPHQHRQRWKEGEVPLPRELTIPLVAVERDRAIPAGIEPRRQVPERIGHQREAGLRRQPDRDHGEVRDDEDGEAGRDECADRGSGVRRRIEARPPDRERGEDPGTAKECVAKRQHDERRDQQDGNRRQADPDAEIHLTPGHHDESRGRQQHQRQRVEQHGRPRRTDPRRRSSLVCDHSPPSARSSTRIRASIRLPKTSSEATPAIGAAPISAAPTISPATPA